MLKTMPIKSEPLTVDGKRISVMSRHTKSDGQMPDPEISPEHYHEWWTELSPPASLVVAYFKRGSAWLEFT